MTAFQVSLAVWLSWAFLFLVLETLALLDVVPWNSLSWTAWQIQARWPLTAIGFAGGLFVLLLHIVLPGSWPRRGTRYVGKDDTEGKT